MGGIVASAPLLTLKATSINLTNMANATIISFNSTGITLAADLAMNYNSISGLTNLIASGPITSDTAITYTLTTSAADLNIKCDFVLFKGVDNTIYMDAHPGGVLFYTAVYMESTLKIQNEYFAWITIW